MAADAVDALAELVAASTTFQTWVGAADATEAKTHVYQDAEDGPDEDPNNDNTGYTRPFALVAEEMDAYVDVLGPYTSGRLVLHFESDILTSQLDQHTGPARTFRSNVHETIRDMMDTQGGSGYLIVRSITSTTPTYRSDDAEESGDDIGEGDAYLARQFIVEYGVT